MLHEAKVFYMLATCVLCLMSLEEAVSSSNFILTYMCEVSNGKESGFLVNVNLDNGKDLGLVMLHCFINLSWALGIFVVGVDVVGGGGNLLVSWEQG